MLAEIVILRNNHSLDKRFTYEVPDKYRSSICVGSRVLVSFGASGVIEGIVYHLFEGDPDAFDYKLKKITYLFDDGVFLTENDIEIADQIRTKTICSYAEAVQLFLPSGTLTKQIKTYALTPKGLALSSDEKKQLKKPEQVVLEILQSGELQQEAIKTNYAVQTQNNAINRMVAMDYVDLNYSYENNVKDRYVDWITVKGDLILYKSKLPKNHTAKHKLVSFLIENPKVKRLAIQEELHIGKTVVDNLLKDKVIGIESVEDLRIPTFMTSYESKQDIKLNTEQQLIYNQIVEKHENGQSHDFLIHGITGSGKTEVYAELIEYTIAQGKKAILLVPEISLTPQIVARFVSRFGKERIALIHSKISAGEKHDQWKGIRRGDYDIIIGARSAIFAPTDDVGIIIVDECHENSFKSEKRPKYNTLDVAKLRMHLNGGLIVSGSATPSIVDYYDALEGNKTLVKLQSRYNEQDLPQIDVIDMRQELISGNKSILSTRLHDAIALRLEKKEQSIIFLNRKGHSTFVSCRSCGFTLACPHCDVTLTYFKGEKTVKCNYCSYETYVPKLCPKCQSKYFKFFGVGTEKVEEMIREMFPSAVVARMDRTTTTRKGSIEQIISDVEASHTDILIGTQMVTKGFDFKNVTLIGILSADLILNLPHYQASERAYQLFTQVAGRAGRGDKKGEVILQTYAPDHYAVNQSSYESFYEQEIHYRDALKYPPFYQLINILLLSKDDKDANLYAEKSYAYIMKKLLKKDLQNDIEVFKPNPALLKKIDNMYRWQIVLKSKPEHMDILRSIFFELEEKFIEVNNCKINIDLDATNIL